MENYYSIGKIAATIGLKGEVILRHSLGKSTSLKGADAIFIEEKKNSFLPYFITKAKSKNNSEIILQLEGITSPEKAKALLQKEIFFTEKLFKQFTAATAPVAWLGFLVIDKNAGELGIIEEITQMPQQILAKIIYQEKEIWIPLHEATIQHSDKSKKMLHVNLPDGLLSVYLS